MAEDVVIIESTFEEVFPIWRDNLWPNRVSKIEPLSNLFWRQPKEIIKDNTIFEKYTPTFFAIKIYDEIVGVNSGFKTHDKVYRSRGLWVSEEQRGRGFGQLLLLQAIIQGKSEDCHWIWSMPRKTALESYEKAGFKKRGKWIDQKVEFGPNCLATRQLIYK